MLDKGKICCVGGTGQDFIVQLKMALNLNFINSIFLNFPFNIFVPWLTEIMETAQSKITDKGVYCVVK